MAKGDKSGPGAPESTDKPGALEVIADRVAGQFRHVSTTILVAVGVAAAIGIGALWLLYDIEQDAVVIEQNERTMEKLTDVVVRGFEAVMLQGTADAVDTYAERLQAVGGIADLRVMRIDGSEAFKDNRTINEVNARFKSTAFKPHATERTVQVMPASSPHLSRTVAETRPVRFYETDDAGDRVLTVLRPLANGQACQGCHGTDHEVRGVLKVTTSLRGVERAIAQTRYKTVAVMVVALGVILGITYTLLRMVVTRRVARFNEAMNAVVMGDFSRRVPEGDRDELGEMARSFNRMAENLLAASSLLHEGQDMMTAVLRSAHEGVVVADRNGDIVMANAAAEQMLGKTSMQILRDGLIKLFDNPTLMNTWRGALGDVSEEINYRGKAVQIYMSRIRGPNDRMLGFAVLMRDISGERQLREEIRRLHFTDEETGIGNERYLEHALAHAWSRARTGTANVTLVLVSIDTFKEVLLARGAGPAIAIAKRAAVVMTETFGKAVPVARMTGDTFAAVVAGSSSKQVAVTTEEVLTRIHDSPIEGLDVWASAGISTASARAVDGAGDLVKSAGRALSQAIEVGGASVRISDVEGAG